MSEENGANEKNMASEDAQKENANVGASAEQAAGGVDLEKDAQAGKKKRIIPADVLEYVPKNTSTDQKIVIFLGIIALIAIALFFNDAEVREDYAAQSTFQGPVAEIIQNANVQSGMSVKYGVPKFTLNATTKQAAVQIRYPRALPAEVAAYFAQAICGAVAHSYVVKGYMPRGVTVTIGAYQPDGYKVDYGTAVYNGNTDRLRWRPAKRAVSMK